MNWRGHKIPYFLETPKNVCYENAIYLIKKYLGDPNMLTDVFSTLVMLDKSAWNTVLDFLCDFKHLFLGVFEKETKTACHN